MPRGSPPPCCASVAGSCCAQIVNKPSFLEYKGRRFLIIDAPTDRNVQQYIKEFKKYNVTNLVRACSPSYDTAAVVSEGVTVHVSAGSCRQRAVVASRQTRALALTWR